MKLARLAFLLIPFAFFACSETTSSEDSRGDLVYSVSAKSSSLVGRCSVYVADKRVTMVFDQVVTGVGTMEYTSQIEIGSSSVTISDVFTSSSNIFKESMDGNCSGLKGEYEPRGGKVTCSATEVNASMEIASTPAKLTNVLDTAIGTMKAQCDYYVERVKFADQDEAAYEPALSCNVDQVGDTVYMSVTYIDKAAIIKVYDLAGELTMQEVYSGVDSETLEDVCFVYQHDNDKKDVLCEGNTLTYQSNEPGESVEETMVLMRDFACPAFLNGYTSLEDMWFSE